VGNKVDVDECDLLEYLCDDPNTKAIGFYLESFSDGRRFANVCRNSTKPIVVLKGGKSQRGAEAAMSHTASMAGNYKVTRGVMAQSGIIEAKDFKQMVDLCRSLAACGSIRKENRDGRIAIISFSGGAGIVASDFIEEQNLKVADLSDKTVGTLKEIYPKWMPVANPIDLWPAIEINGAAKAYNTATEAVLGDPGIDAVIIQVMAGNPVFEVDLTNIAAMAKKADKPVFFWLIGRRDDEANFQSASRDYRLPAFTELFRAVECMSAVFRFGGRDGYSDASKSIEAASGDREKTVNQALNNSLDNKFGPLDEHASKTFLAACGIPVVEEKIADNYPSLKDIIASSKYPVVMKGLPERVEIHKTDRGLVKLNIKSEEEAKNTFETLMNNMGGKGRVLVYSQVGGRFELIAGLIRDQEFGPCVMLGVGGIMAEVINDVAFAMAPLSISDALMMMDNLRSRKMFDGFRGEKAADKKKVAQLLVDLGNIGVNYPRIKEIDVNPFIISESEPIAVDASIILTEEDKKK
jgi:acetyltransferase